MKISPYYYKQYSVKYQKRKILFNSKELKKLINNLYQQAIQNYSKLSKPKFCSQKAYISIWINEEISHDIAKKSAVPININKIPDDLKESIKFYQNDLYHQLSPKTKISVLTVAKLDYIKVIKEKNIFAKNRGYKSYIDLRLDNEHISQKEYQAFLKNIGIFIINTKKYLIKPNLSEYQLSNICFVCQSKPLPYKNINEFVKIFSKKYPLLKKHNQRIQINLSNISNSEYIKENDTFKININKNIKLNHQIIDFLHEIGHIDLMIKIFQKDSYIQPNSYILEKMAIKKEINLIKKYLPEMLIPKIEYVLMTICHTLFEIKLLNNPNQNPDILYSKLLNKFYINKNQKEDYGYLFNKNILFKNLSQLTYAIAYCNVFINFFLKNNFNLNSLTPKHLPKENIVSN